MDCPRCRGCVVEVIERDDLGDNVDCLACINCGWREYAPIIGKYIPIIKGQVSHERV